MELAKQANIRSAIMFQYFGTTEALTESELYDFNNMQKFAEFIVQECIDVLVDVLPAIVLEAKDGIHPVWHIKEHFGVEE